MARLDGAKGNYSPPAENATWLKMRGQCLDNDPLVPDWVGVFTEHQDELIQAAGKRDQQTIEGESALRNGLTRLDLRKGQEVPAVEVIEKLMSDTDKSRAWIYNWIPRYLDEHGSRQAEVDQPEYTWSKQAKKSGGKAQLFIHRELYV